MRKFIAIFIISLLISAPSYALTLRKVTNKSLAAKCGTQRALARGEIWKSRQSPHIPSSDRRKYSSALIYLSGKTTPSSNCLNVFDEEGNLLHKLGIYARRESLYAARFYGGAGCGDAKTPSRIASLAKSNTGSVNVYIDIGSVCLKIDDPRECVNSVGC